MVRARYVAYVTFVSRIVGLITVGLLDLRLEWLEFV